MQALEAEQVVHFDLKCDNILLEPLETPRDPAALPFRVVLSDFGESRMYASVSSALTVRWESCTANGQRLDGSALHHHPSRWKSI